MGSDSLYLSPCCKLEDFDFTYREKGIDYYKCNSCGKVFSEHHLLTETLDYDKDELER